MQLKWLSSFPYASTFPLLDIYHADLDDSVSYRNVRSSKKSGEALEGACMTARADDLGKTRALPSSKFRPKAY
jgi:hypothetical protein